MVDNVNPTSQFHPYQPQDATPQSERPVQGGLGGILSKLAFRTVLDMRPPVVVFDVEPPVLTRESVLTAD